MIALEPRRINEVRNLGWLLRHWRAPDSSNAAPREAGRSSFGNINVAVTPYASPSLLLPASDPNFFVHIEPGVRSLVGACLELELITYTSCEGHFYSKSYADERHVGLVMRNAKETEWILSVWTGVGEVVGATIAKSACELAYMDHRIKCSDRLIRALDLYIVKRSTSDWQGYFDSLDEVTLAVVGQLLKAAECTKDVAEHA